MNTPRGIHPVFHTCLLHRASEDPLPLQQTTHDKPGPTLIGTEQEYDVKAIQKHRKRGRGWQVLVEWKGWAKPTWEPLSALQETEALCQYEDTHDVQWAIVRDSTEEEGTDE